MHDTEHRGTWAAQPELVDGKLAPWPLGHQRSAATTEPGPRALPTKRWGGFGNARLHVLPTALFLLIADSAPLLLGAAFHEEYWRPFLAVTLVLTVLNAAAGLYRPRVHLSLLDDLPSLLARQVSAAGITVLGAGVIGSSLPDARELITLLALWMLLSLALRAVGYEVIRQCRRHGLVRHRTLVVGGGRVGLELAHILRQHPEYGLVPVGCVDDQPTHAAFDPALPYLGTFSDVHCIADREDSRVLLFAFGVAREQQMIDALRSSRGSRYDLFVVPRLFELTGLQGFRDHIGAIPVIRMARVRHRGVRMLMKRTFDVVVSVAALVLLSPALAVCAVAVRATGPGVIFRQPRVGKNGCVFDLLKFRSMTPVTEQDSATTWAVATDPRVTRVGKLLRRTSFDELPQLWNIIRGQMTIVGPRPERPFYVEQFSREIPSYLHRHRVPVGLTGLAQISGLRGGDASIERRARYDNYYIEHWSLWGDVKVMIRTLSEVLAARGG